MKFLICGGSFNPLHIGHLQLVEEVASEFSYDKIIMVPTFISPFKQGFTDVGTIHRLNMLRLATSSNDLYVVDDCEIKRGGLSYTVETIPYLIDKYHMETKPGFVIGDDLASTFNAWKNPEIISSISDIIIANREAVDYGVFQYNHKKAHNIILPISSTDIKKRIIEARPWKNLVPECIAKYIIENNLYTNI